MRILPSLFAAALAAALSSAAPAARAQSATEPDSGMLVIFDQRTPVAHERFVWQNMGDSILVTALSRRSLLDDKGVKHPFEKGMLVVVDSRDFGLLRYVSTQKFQDLTTVRGLLPGDTVFTYYTETGDGGSARRLVQPPGRLFVIDSPMFSLFDVLVRSLAGKEFESRRVQLLTLTPDTLVTPTATITRGQMDTLSIGERTVRARHYTLEDESVRFELWTDVRGRLVRMSHSESGMVVERAESASAAPKPRPRPRAATKR